MWGWQDKDYCQNVYKYQQIEGKRGRGRTGMLSDKKEGKLCQQMEEEAQDRVKLRRSS